MSRLHQTNGRLTPAASPMARDPSLSSLLAGEGDDPSSPEPGSDSPVIRDLGLAPPEIGKSNKMMAMLNIKQPAPPPRRDNNPPVQQARSPPPPTPPQLQVDSSRASSPQLAPLPASSTNYTRSLLSRPSHGRSGSASSMSSIGSAATPMSPAQGGTASPALVSSAVNAFALAGQRRDGRRGGLAEQGYDALPTPQSPQQTARKGSTGAATPGARKPPVLDPQVYPNTPAFREIDRVLALVSQSWPQLLLSTSLVNQGPDDEEEEFDAVELALMLLEDEKRGGRRLDEFDRLKKTMGAAISLSLSSSTTSHRAYDLSLHLHSSLTSSLTSSVSQIAGLRTHLLAARGKMEPGGGGEGMKGMWGRVSQLEEMARLLDEIDNLRSIPERLEALLSEKRFLSAVTLLVRSLKMVNKDDMKDIGAVADLRAWMRAQEGVMLEMLVEELHNHLYLKSFYCDARWKSYTRGQTELPLVDFGDDYDGPLAPASHLEASFHHSGRSTARLPRMTKLQRYLNVLSLKPSHNPLLDEVTDDLPDSGGKGFEEALGELGGTSIADGMADFAFLSSSTPAAAKANPEADSFAYIESLVESLACLGKLGHGLDAISGRIQVEMFTLVEATVDEVGERNELTRRQGLNFRSTTTAGSSAQGGAGSGTTVLGGAGGAGQLASHGFGVGNGGPGGEESLLSLGSLLSRSGGGGSIAGSRGSVLRITASESSEMELNVETLKDLFWTLYSKLDAVLQGFRVAYEVALRIAERKDFKESSMVRTSSGALIFSLVEVWKPIQSEVRTLLQDYLTDDQSGTVSKRNPIVSVNEVLRTGRTGRDPSKQIFKFSDSDRKTSLKLLKTFEDDLNRALKAAVPGLITEGAAAGPAAQGQIVINPSAADVSTGAVSTSADGGPAGTHKVLVTADAFNVSVLFGPTLSFLKRVKDVMPSGLLGDDTDTSAFGGFLEEFVLRTFLPQLEEKVTSVFQQAVGGLDAFQEDPNYRRVSNVPIVKSVCNLMLLISSLCNMLRETPFHRENYSQLIVSVIHQFYQRCDERFKDLAGGEAPQQQGQLSDSSNSVALRVSGRWAQVPEINDCLHELRTSLLNGDAAQVQEALKKETRIQVERKGNRPIEGDDLVRPSKRLLALGTLYSSLNWFIHHVSALKTSFDPSAATNGNVDASVDGSVDGSPSVGSDSEDDDPKGPVAPLPLTKEMAKPFEALLTSYQKLADLVLFTLRIEIRARTMHFLDKATRDGVYQLPEDVLEPDPFVVDLNSDLAECDECAAMTLADAERTFVFEGLSQLMDQLLITNARYIRLANKHGMSKMMRNILALRQNLKNLGEKPLEADFDRSRKYWETFGKGPKDMLDAIQSGSLNFEFEEYKTLLNLQCGVDQSAKDEASFTSEGPPNSAGATVSERARRQYNEWLIELHALSNEDW